MKNFLKSKTLWLNLVAFVLFGIQGVLHSFPVDPTVQAEILAMLNFGLRFLTTHGVVVGTPDIPQA